VVATERRNRLLLQHLHPSRTEAVAAAGTDIRPRLPPPVNHTAVVVVADMDTVLRKLQRLRQLLTGAAVAVITAREQRTLYRRIPPFVRTSLLFIPYLRLFAMLCSLLRWITSRLAHR
jgi:hypothetical protein